MSFAVQSHEVASTMTGLSFYRHRSKVDYVVRGKAIYRLSDGVKIFSSNSDCVIDVKVKQLEKPFYSIGITYKFKVGYLAKVSTGYKLTFSRKEQNDVSVSDV